MPLFVIGCATTPDPIYITRTETVYQDKYIPIPESLTAPVEVPALTESFDIYELGAVAKAREIRLLQCNGQLHEIASIKPE